ncbi:MAG: PIG-L family deacetylase [Chthonomonadales bacterium]|nr:PIG-L family deacetylase [Chthonomonadales bacterium]
MRARLILRMAIAAAAIPCLWVGGAGARYLLRTQAADRKAAERLSTDFPSPRPSQRYLIVSPHPDDETLACGGLIQRALQAHAEVRVIFVTCGDGYRAAVERQFRKLRITPEDYLQFGEIRRNEALAAARELGLAPAQLRFLGMPDGRMTDLWRSRLTDERSVSNIAQVRVPYEWAVQPGSPYSGAAVLRLLEDQMAEYRPTHVLIPHPSDDHGDHAAVSAFARAAILDLTRREPFPPTPVILHYLVHRGDWPQPQGLRIAMPLAPPAEMMGLDTMWHGLALRDGEIARKLRAVRAYRSQTAVMPRYMLSFARSTEFYGIIPDAYAPLVSPGRPAAPTLLGQAVPVVLDAVDDSLLRRLQAQCDIRAVMAAVAGDELYLRVNTVKPPSRTATTKVFARVLGTYDDPVGDAGMQVTARGGRVQGNIEALVSSDQGGTSVVLPLDRSHQAGTAILDIETSVAGVVVDRTGPRVVRMGSGD